MLCRHVTVDRDVTATLSRPLDVNFRNLKIPLAFAAELRSDSRHLHHVDFGNVTAYRRNVDFVILFPFGFHRGCLFLRLSMCSTVSW